MKAKPIAKLTLACLLSILVSLLSPAVIASTLQVLPVGLFLSAAKPASSLSMINSGDEPVVVQGELFEWQVVNGEHVLTPTEDVLFNPPVFTVPQGQSQTVRVGVIRPMNNTVEKSYRLFLQEVPSAQVLGGGVKIALRFSMPIFVAPIVPPITDLGITAKAASSRSVTVKLTNTGNVHMALKRFLLTSDANNKMLAELDSLVYLTAGGTSQVTLTARDPLPSGKLSLSIETDHVKKFEGSVSR